MLYAVHRSTDRRGWASILFHHCQCVPVYLQAVKNASFFNILTFIYISLWCRIALCMVSSLKSADTLWVEDLLQDTGGRPEVIFVFWCVVRIWFQKHKKEVGGLEAAGDLTQGLTSPEVCEARIQY